MDTHFEVEAETDAWLLLGRDSNTLAMSVWEISTFNSKSIPYTFDHVVVQCFTFPRSSSVGSFPLMMVGELGANLVYL